MNLSRSSATRDMVVCLAIVFLVVCVGIFLPIVSAVQPEPNDAAPPSETVSTLLYMHERFWPIIAIVVVIAIVGVIRISHQIARPLERLKRQLRAIGEGHLPPPLATRRRDYFQDETEALNEMVARLAERFAAVEQASADLERRIEELRSQPAPDEVLGAVEDALLAVERILDGIHDEDDEPASAGDREPAAEART